MTSVASVTSRSERLSRGARAQVPARGLADGAAPIPVRSAHAASPERIASAPDRDAAARLGLRQSGVWTAEGHAALARLRAAAGAPRLLSPAACVARAQAWGRALGLSLVRLEASSGVAEAAFPGSVPCGAPAGSAPSLRLVGADSWGRRLVLGEACAGGSQSVQGIQGWTLSLILDAVHLNATLLHLLESDRAPLWLASEQVRVLPLSEGALAPAAELLGALGEAGLRVALDSRGTLAARVRSAGLARVPAMVLLGPREVACARFTLRWRTGESLSLEREALLAALLSAARWDAARWTPSTLGVSPPSPPPGHELGRNHEPAPASGLAPSQAPHRR